VGAVVNPEGHVNASGMVARHAMGAFSLALLTDDQKVRSNRAQFKAFLLSVRELSVPVGIANRVFGPRYSTGIMCCHWSSTE
jgi:hypothetical protein